MNSVTWLEMLNLNQVEESESSQVRSIHFPSALNSPEMNTVAKISSKDFFSDSLMIAESDSSETQALKWEKQSTKGYYKWEDWRYDRETFGGRAPAHDMFYAFVFLPWSPVLSVGAPVEKNFNYLWSRTFKSTANPHVPTLSSLKQLKGSDVLTNGMWLILVRMPRPQHGKPHIPLSQRKDYKKFSSETEEEWQLRKADIKKKSEIDVHPTEGQLYLTANNTLLQEVGKHIVCSKCGAKGHHHEKSHDDVYSPADQSPWEQFIETCPNSTNLHEEWAKWQKSANIISITHSPTYPQWMNIKEYPKEMIVLTKLLEEDKGLTLHIRQAETKIPLRLARKLLMDGMDIQGDVYASGVGTRKQVSREAEEEEKQKKSKWNEPEKLFIDISDEDKIRHEYQEKFIIDLIAGVHDEQYCINAGLDEYSRLYIKSF
jgi:hypothetical protein